MSYQNNSEYRDFIAYFNIFYTPLLLLVLKNISKFIGFFGIFAYICFKLKFEQK